MKYAFFLSTLLIGAQLLAQGSVVVVTPRKDPYEVLADGLREMAERQRAEREKLRLEKQRKDEIKLQLFAEHVRGMSPEEVAELVKKTRDPVIREAYAPFLDFVPENPQPAAAIPGLITGGTPRTTTVAALGEPTESRFDNAGKEILLYPLSESATLAVILARNVVEQIVIVSVSEPARVER